MKQFICKINNKKKTKTNKNKQKLFPWCTCTGSKVCTYYTNKFGKKDGTHIKFIGKMQNKTNVIKFMFLSLFFIQ